MDRGFAEGTGHQVGCETSRTLYVPRAVPPLDSGLAVMCPEISDPPRAPASYDEWQVWVQDVVLVEWGVCGATSGYRRGVAEVLTFTWQGILILFDIFLFASVLKVRKLARRR